MIYKTTTRRLRAVEPKKEAPIGGLGDKRFVYVPHDEHTLDGFRARMNQYRAGIQAVAKAKEGS